MATGCVFWVSVRVPDRELRRCEANLYILTVLLRCLGQKFAQIEAVAVITSVIRKYQVLLKEDVDGSAPQGESRDDKRERITKCKTVITLTPKKVPFVFVERSRGGAR